jgi:DNA processing protein
MHGFMLAIIANKCPYVNTLKCFMYSVKSLTLQGNHIPEQLRSIPDAPKTLFYRGRNLTDLLSNPSVAIVGSRKVDQYGTYVTKLISGELARKGAVIVSGLALGVDAIAHTSALDSGGESLAVLACGIDRIYPRTNDQLGRRLMEHGGILSEHSSDYSPRLYDFLIRNRLISALSQAVIVTQAAARSGSLNTARHALEQGRTVMAVPGPITNPLCEGPNNLLKMGAVPVTSADDVLKTLNISTEQIAGKDYDLLAENEYERSIIMLLKEGVTDAEELIVRSELTVQQFNLHLTMLEIRGVIQPLGANNWTLS